MNREDPEAVGNPGSKRADEQLHGSQVRRLEPSYGVAGTSRLRGNNDRR
jgi:hypothetical protein